MQHDGFLGCHGDFCLKPPIEEYLFTIKIDKKKNTQMLNVVNKRMFNDPFAMLCCHLLLCIATLRPQPKEQSKLD